LANPSAPEVSLYGWASVSVSHHHVELHTLPGRLASRLMGSYRVQLLSSVNVFELTDIVDVRLRVDELWVSC